MSSGNGSGSESWSEASSELIDQANAAIDSLVTSASGPQSVTSDAGSVTQRSARDLIAVSNYLAGVAAAQTLGKGVRFTRLVPDATVQGPRRGYRQPWLGFPDDWNGYGWP